MDKYTTLCLSLTLPYTAYGILFSHGLRVDILAHFSWILLDIVLHQNSHSKIHMKILNRFGIHILLQCGKQTAVGDIPMLVPYFYMQLNYNALVFLYNGHVSVSSSFEKEKDL